MGPGSRSLRSLVRDDEIDSIFKQPGGYASAISRRDAPELCVKRFALEK
jgi:hypothetical protein